VPAVSRVEAHLGACPAGGCPGFFAGERRLEGDTQAIDIGLGSGLHAAILFGGGVARRAERAGVTRLAGSVAAGDAEVDQVESTPRGDHDVGRLHIAEDDGRALPVEMRQDITERDADLCHLPQGKSALGRACEQLFESLPFDIVHHDIPVFGIGELVMDAGEVFVLQSGEQGDLAVEGVGDLDFFLGAQGGHVDLFDGDEFAMLAPVARFVDDAEASFTDPGEDAVAPGQQGTQLKRCVHTAFLAKSDNSPLL
jgi:hypothetical protein